MKIRFFFSIGMLLLAACGSGFDRTEYVGGALGTSYNIITITDKDINLQSKIDSVFTAVNASLSTYQSDSYISRINNGDSSVVVDYMLSQVFMLSKKVYKDTDGAFDPTVGTLVNAWGFGPETKVALDSAKVDSLMNYVGFDKVRLNRQNKIEKVYPEIFLDFNAVGKGYAIDRLAAMCNQLGIQHYLIEVGGEIIAKGSNILKDKSWIVGIDDPQVTKGRSNKHLIKLGAKALASSGNYRKFRLDTVTGKKYVHTINPKTGYTHNSNTLAVTILAENCATADAYATAFMAMELSEAFKLILRHKDLEAYIIYIDEEGKTQEFFTKGFENALVR